MLNKNLHLHIKVKQKHYPINIGLIIIVILASITTWFLTEFLVYELNNMDMVATEWVGKGRPKAIAATILHVGSGQPYSTIQAAVNAANSGDTIKIHPGTYHETVTIVNTKSDLTIEAYDPSNPPELDGAAQSFNPTWTNVQGKIYKTTYDLPYTHKTPESFTSASYPSGTGKMGDPIMTVYEDDIWLKGYEGTYPWTETPYPYSTLADLDPSTDDKSASKREIRIPGRFMYDDSANQLYVWTAKEHGEDHPSNHRYNIPVLKHLILIDAPRVKLKNLVLKHTYYYAIYIKSNGDSSIIENCYVVNTGPWAIKSYQAENVKILNNFIQLKGFYERQDYISVRFTILKGNLVYLDGLTNAKNCEIAGNVVSGTYNLGVFGQGCQVHDNIVSKSQSILIIPDVPGHLTPKASPGYIHNVKVYNNIFHHADFSVFTSYNTWTPGLNQYYGPLWFYRNVMYAVPQINKDGCQESPCDPTPSIFIYHNTFVLGKSVVHHPYDYPVHKRTVYRNNIIQLRHNQGMEMYWIYSDGEKSKSWLYFPFDNGADSDYNIYLRNSGWNQIARFRNKVDVDAGIYTSYKVGEFALMQSETGYDPHSREVNPLFIHGDEFATASAFDVNYDQFSNMNYKNVISEGYINLYNEHFSALYNYFNVQSADSPAIDKGEALPTSWPDIVTIIDGKPDIGAVEYQDGEVCTDSDSDGYGVCPDCGTANGCTYDGHDCDDSEIWANPGGTETCDTVDNNCSDPDHSNGVNSSDVDEGCDDDSDQYCDENMKVYRNNTMCVNTPFIDGRDGDDCDDNNNAINPGASEICTNGIDEDCDGTPDDGCGSGNIYYVSPNSSASWSQCANINTPCSISTANTNARAGDTVYLREGVYYSQQINPLNSGTSDSDRIIFKNYNDEQIELNGRDSGLAIYLNKKDYITIDGLFINDWRKGFILYDGADYNIIQNCRFLELDAYTGNEIANRCVDINGLDCSGYGEPCNFNIILSNTFLDAPRDDNCKSDSYCASLPKDNCNTDIGCWWCSKNSSRTCWATGDQSCTTYCGTQPDDIFEISSGYGNVVEKNWFGNAAHSDFIISHNATDHTVVRGNRFENGYRRGGATTYFTEWQLWEENEFFDICKEQEDNPLGVSKNQDIAYAGAGIQFAGTGCPDYVILRKNLFQHTGNVISGMSEYFRIYHNSAHGMYKSFGHEGDDFRYNVIKNNIFTGLGVMDKPTEYDPGHFKIFVQAPQCSGFTTQSECESFHGYCTWEANKCRGEWLNSNLFVNNTFYQEGIYWRYGWDGGLSTTKTSLSGVENTFPDQFPKGANLISDPQLVDPLNHNFHLTSNSAMIDAGTWLTKTTSAGSGAQIPVEDALYFYDGWGIPGEQGDLIQLEGQASPIRIIKVDYDNNLLTVDKSVSWNLNQGISLPYTGSAPDIGAVEYQASGGTCTDTDSDGYGVCPDCGIANGCAYDGHDCEDSEKWANPSGTETCDTVDNNCSGAADEGCDDDKDKYCDENMKVYRNNSMCVNTIFIDGRDGDDCNDTKTGINPGASEICGNGVDEDCDGVPDDGCGLTSGLIAHYKLDETSGNIASDSSGNHYDGTLEYTPTWTTGRINNALQFNGANDYIYLGDTGLANQDYNGFTLSAWYKSSNNTIGGATVADEYIFIQTTTGAAGGIWPWIDFSITDDASHTGQVSLRVKQSWFDTTWGQVYGTTNVVDQAWHHIAAVRTGNGAGSRLKIYVDGQLEADVADQNGGGILDNASGDPNEIYVGAMEWWGENYTDGLIDDLRIYDRALNSSEIQELYDLAPFLLPSLSVGLHTITLTTTDSQGYTAYDTIQIEILPENTLTAQINMLDTEFTQGDTIYFTSEASGGDSPYTYSWNSDKQGNFSTQSWPEIDSANWQTGNHMITLMVTDSSSNMATDNITITINPAASVCGDGTCDAGETCSSCPADCGSCPTGDTYYVSPNGTASWTQCTSINTPCSVTTAEANATAGDTVYFRGGTYFRENLRPANSGVNGSPIIFMAYQSETPVFDGEQITNVAFFLANRSYITIDGFNIIRYTGYSVNMNNNGVYAYGQIIKNCVIKDNGSPGSGGGLFSTSADGIEIINNVFDLSNSGLGGIVLYGSKNGAAPLQNSRIEGNTIIGCDGYNKGCSDAITIHVSDNSPYYSPGDHHLIKNNLIYGWGENCVDLASEAKYVVVTGNILYDAYWQVMNGLSNYRRFTDNDIYQVKAWTGDEWIYLGSKHWEAIGPAQLARNRFWGSGNGIAACSNNTGSGCLSAWVRNLYVFNNTFDGTDTNFGGNSQVSIFHVRGDDNSYLDNINFKNNIFYYKDTIYGIQFLWVSYEPLNSDYNLYWETTNSPGANIWRYNGSRTLSYVKANYGREYNSIEYEPGFTDQANHDYTLQSGSHAINTGDFLTTVTSPSGSGASFKVDDSNWFYDGWGIAGETGDNIKTESGQTATITNIDYSSNIITVNQSITWTQGENIALDYSGSAPDIGAYEY